MSRYGTHFLESEAVLAVTADDDEGVMEALNQMSDSEKSQFRAQLKRLISLIEYGPIMDKNGRFYP